MVLHGKAVRLSIVLALLSVYALVSFSYYGTADPTGASINLINVDDGPVGIPGQRTDPGGKIITTNLEVIQQDQAWKAYIGNITGALVLRSSNSFSIYEWDLDDSALSGNVFVSRSATINWTPIACASSGIILAEDATLGTSPSSADSINRTFNYTIHKPMTISGIGTIPASTCRSTATYVNGTSQVVSEDASFQQILLSDSANLVYATFIDQDDWGFDNNGTNGVTYDFQLIVGENRTDATGHTYYFYADIS